MASLNQCNFIGNVGKIESRFMSNGDMVVNLSLAVDDSYKDKNGQKVEQTEWINFALYKGLAKIADEYVQKGKSIYLSGKMKTRKWTDKNGVERYTTEIIATDMKMLGGRPSGSDSRPASNPHQSNTGFDDMEDLPF